MNYGSIESERMMAVHNEALGTAEEQAANAERLRVELARKLNEYEARYELSSDHLEEELDAGRLRETAEVAEWFVVRYAHRALLHARTAGLD